jgi:undecaprenyl-diphosphatase
MTIKNKILIILAAILAGGFLAIALLVADGKTQALDEQWSQAIYDLRTPVLTQIMAAASAISSTMFTGLLTAIVILFFWIKKQHKTAIFFGAILAISVIANNLIKYSIRRIRPETSPIEDASWYSFPSGHAMNSLVFYGVLLFLANRSIKNKKLLLVVNIAAPIFVALVGFSRVYLGAHYPTDVIAGFLAGGAILIFGVRRGETMFSPAFKFKFGRLHGIAPTNTNSK